MAMKAASDSAGNDMATLLGAPFSPEFRLDLTLEPRALRHDTFCYDKALKLFA